MADDQEAMQADYLNQSLNLFDSPYQPATSKIVADAVTLPDEGDLGIQQLTQTFDRLRADDVIDDDARNNALPRAVAATVMARSKAPQRTLHFSRAVDPQANLRPNNFYFNINGNNLQGLTNPAQGVALGANEYNINNYDFPNEHEELLMKKLYYEFNFRRLICTLLFYLAVVFS